ncbi:unnamed protein product [Blepharisma stoltei]|uniref:Translin-associated factor X-interacting protein 1 N-terminal domain-containing protein n=1 Tax=Blepharisma stoltei TaxID=1481888 RepID=A0AAU9IWR5_9CILI|nr:unnamed protein product [Blepharisma stoltei]
MKSVRKTFDSYSKQHSPDLEDSSSQQLIHPKFLNFQYVNKPKRESSKSPANTKNFYIEGKSKGNKSNSIANKIRNVGISPAGSFTQRIAIKNVIDKSLTLTKIGKHDSNQFILSKNRTKVINSIKSIDLDKLTQFKDQINHLKHFNSLKTGLRMNFERIRGKSIPKWDCMNNLNAKLKENPDNLKDLINSFSELNEIVGKFLKVMNDQEAVVLELLWRCVIIQLDIGLTKLYKSSNTTPRDYSPAVNNIELKLNDEAEQIKKTKEQLNNLLWQEEKIPKKEIVKLEDNFLVAKYDVDCVINTQNLAHKLTEMKGQLKEIDNLFEKNKFFSESYKVGESQWENSQDSRNEQNKT